MSAISGQRLASLTIRTIEAMRTDEDATAFFEFVRKRAEKHNMIEEPVVARSQRKPNYSILLFFSVQETGSGDGIWPKPMA